jgi:hypothetical protein
MALAAAAGDWFVLLLLIALILSWWAFLAWWISRYGGREVRATFASVQPPTEALQTWLDCYGIWLASAGYRIVDRRGDRIAFVGQYRPRWAIAVAVLLFPFGLVALLGVTPAQLVVTADDESVTAEGKMHRRMAKELEKDAADEPPVDLDA